MPRQRILILGTRTLAEEVADLISDGDEFEVTGFVENMDRARCSEPLLGLPVHWMDDIAPMANSHMAVCALGTTKRGLFTDQVKALGFRFATIIHSSARLSRTSTIGAGSILSAGVIVAAHTTIGEHVFVNRGALIGHHTTIGQLCSVMPGANIAGSCTIGERCYVGMGAVVIDHVSIGDRCVLAAGAVVTKSLPDGVQVMGVPARVVGDAVEGR